VNGDLVLQTPDMVVRRMVDAIRKRGSLRTPGLAEVFKLSEHEIDALLAYLCGAGGALICCDVELAGGKRVKEYRCSTVGGGKLIETYVVGRPRTKPAPKPDPAFGGRDAMKESLAKRFQEAGTPAKKEIPMSTSDKILAAFRDHGPMTVHELRRHVKVENLSTLILNLRIEGKVNRLSGSPRRSVWGLPGRKAGAPSATPSPAPAPAPAIAPAALPSTSDGGKFIGEIKSGVPVPAKHQVNSALRKQLERLKVGDSFETSYTNKAVNYQASCLGIKTICRTIAKGRIGVWRDK